MVKAILAVAKESADGNVDHLVAFPRYDADAFTWKASPIPRRREGGSTKSAPAFH
jgi:hypothetical protein